MVERDLVGHSGSSGTSGVRTERRGMWESHIYLSNVW